MERMTEPTKERDMTIESELQAQVDFLRRPDTVWVRGCPHRENEACMITRGTSGTGAMLSVQAHGWLQSWLWGSHGTTATTTWNDHVASGRDEVVERLEKAVAAAGEQGV
jgi:hypothetical protein